MFTGWRGRLLESWLRRNNAMARPHGHGHSHAHGSGHSHPPARVPSTVPPRRMPAEGGSSLYLSCYAGISGNMFIGALLDAGLPEEALHEMVRALPVSGYRLKIEPVIKCGVKATHFDVLLDRHEQHAHRHLADIAAILSGAALSDRVKARSLAVFTRLAEAEAKVHGTTVDQIHFHEVGAVDAIIDIVGTVFGLEQLGIDAVYAGNLRTGHGVVRCAHGTMPLPAPATAELLNGIPYTHGEIARELLTPTGAALLSVLCDGFGDRPAGFVSKQTAYGAGGMDLEIPNVLRAEIGRIRATPPARSNQENFREKSDTTAGLIVLETNIDDCNPQIFDYVMERLFGAGALDVWLTPVQMKKNRPGVVLSVLVPEALRPAAEKIIFTETTSIGIRSVPVARTALNREEKTGRTPWGEVRVKVSSLNGTVCSITPEYDDCRRLAQQSGVPLKEIQQAAKSGMETDVLQSKSD